MSEYADHQYRTAGRRAWAIRVVLIAVVGVAVWLALEVRSGTDLAGERSIDEPRFWAVVALYFLAGLAFGIAVRYPFPRQRVAWGRVVFVVLMLAPAAHLWFVLAEPVDGVPGWLVGPYWYDQLEVAVVGAILSGVAAASAPGARRLI